MTTTTVDKKDVPMEGLGPSADDVLSMSNDFAKLYLSKLIEMLDIEDELGAFGDKGWRDYLFNRYLETEAEDEPTPPQQPPALATAVISVGTPTLQ